MIKPHGSDELNPLFIYDTEKRHALIAEAESLPSILLNSAAAANAVMLGGGYFNPLTGYMNKADALSVAETMRTTSGLFWPVPILNLTNETVAAGSRIALRDPNVEGNPVLALMDVEAVETVSRDEIKSMAGKSSARWTKITPALPPSRALATRCYRADSGAQLLLFSERFPRYLPHGGGNSQRDS